MQMDDVGPLEHLHAGDVGAGVGDIHLKKVMPAQSIG